MAEASSRQTKVRVRIGRIGNVNSWGWKGVSGFKFRVSSWKPTATAKHEHGLHGGGKAFRVSSFGFQVEKQQQHQNTNTDYTDAKKRVGFQVSGFEVETNNDPKTRTR